MSTRFAITTLPIATLVTLATACSSVLGLEDAHLSALDSADGGTGNADAGPPPLVLKCDGFSSPTHVKVGDLLGAAPVEGKRAYGANLTIQRTPSGQVRLVASQPGANALFVYSLESKSPGGVPAVSRVDVKVLGNALDARRIQGGLGVFSRHQSSGADPAGFDLTPVLDADADGGSMAPFPVATNGGADDSLSAVFTEIAPNDYYYFATYRVSQTPESYAFAVGRTASPPRSPTQLGAISTRQELARALLYDGTNVYGFVGTDPAVGTQMVVLPPSGLAPATPPKGARSLSGALPALMLAAAATATPGKFNVAMGEINAASATAPLALRIAQLDSASLATFTAADLPVSLVLKDVNELPLANGSAAWFGDDFVAIGKGATTAALGANFLWTDARGNKRGAALGTDALLRDRTALRAVTASLGAKPAATLVWFDVAWTEDATDSSGNEYQVLYYNQLVCH